MVSPCRYDSYLVCRRSDHSLAGGRSVPYRMTHHSSDWASSRSRICRFRASALRMNSSRKFSIRR